MKLFFYKSVLVFFLFLLAFHLSYGYVSKKIDYLINEKVSKNSIEIIKEKIKNEMKVALTKEDYIKPEDAVLINNFLDKIKSDLNKNK
tara:strand:- start:324 stop:587 length:264 start_codon:yes stop_codon:yes gene_type:complete